MACNFFSSEEALEIAQAGELLKSQGPQGGTPEWLWQGLFTIKDHEGCRCELEECGQGDFLACV